MGCTSYVGRASDAEVLDAGPPDMGVLDTGPLDAGPADTGPLDTGPLDTGPLDTGPLDTGPPDTGPPDTGPPDTGPLDAGPADTGPPDTGPLDAGTDLGVGDACVAPGVGMQRGCTGRSGERGCGIVYLPGGTFTMGGDAQAPSAITPGRSVRVSAFYLDQYEVTVGRFRRWYQSDAGTPSVTQGSTLLYPNGQRFVFFRVTGPVVAEPVDTGGTNGFTWTQQPGSREHLPMNGMSAFTAQAFCQSEGGRLPTEAEWEYAARGVESPSHPAGRPYPWGQSSPGDCVYGLWSACPDAGVGPALVGSMMPAPLTSCGALYDLGGNVWEVTADSFEEFAGCRTGPGVDPVCLNPDGGVNFTMRGGGWRAGVAGDTGAEALGRYLRGAARATTGDFRGPGFNSVGFRCAYSAGS